MPIRRHSTQRRVTPYGIGEYVFQIGSTLTTGVDSAVEFINGADPFGSVYWLVGSSSTLGVDSIFGGTLLADQSHTLNTGARVDGRVIALNGAVTLDSNIVAIPEPATLWLTALFGFALMLFRPLHTKAITSTCSLSHSGSRVTSPSRDSAILSSTAFISKCSGVPS